jgi:hypothetical protein
VLEAIMAGVIALTAIALFLGVIGGLVVIAHQIRKEDRKFSLVQDAPSLMSRGTRRINGFGCRDLELRVLIAGRRAAA